MLLLVSHAFHHANTLLPYHSSIHNDMSTMMNRNYCLFPILSTERIPYCHIDPLYINIYRPWAMKSGWGVTTTFEEWICLSIGIVSFLLLIPFLFSRKVSCPLKTFLNFLMFYKMVNTHVSKGLMVIFS